MYLKAEVAEKLISWLEEALASPSPLPDSGKDLRIQEEISCTSISDLLKPFVRSGSSGRMFQVPYPQEGGGILEPSSQRWLNSGMVSPTECWTLNTLESPKNVVASSLSDVLETQRVPSTFYLSKEAAVGILRRAENRGKTIPPKLKQALESQVESEP